MKQRNVGGLAEDVFAGWCKAFGVTANKSGDDRKGWDYVVQFASEENVPEGTPLDTRPPELTCLVQVKGTDRRTNRWPIKLTNWLYLIQNPLPAFFLILEFDPEIDPQQPQQAYLVHVDRTWVTKVLERLRKLPPNTELHSKKLHLMWTQANRLKGLTGGLLRDAVRTHIGSDFYVYTLEKLGWIETAGYDESRYRFTVHMAANSEDELMGRLVDFAIGLQEKVPVAKLTLSESRFGIPVTVQDEEFAYAELSMDRKSDKLIDLRLRDGEFRKAVILRQAEVFNPTSVFPFLKEHNIKIRIVAGFVQLLLYPYQKKMNITVKTDILDAPQTIEQLDRFFRLIDVLSEGSRNGLALEAFGTMSGPVILGRMEPGFVLPLHSGQLAPIRDLVWLCRQCEIELDTVVTPEQLINQDQKITRFCTILRRSSALDFSVELTLSSDDRLDHDIRFWSVGHEYVDIGDWRAFVYARLRGEALNVEMTGQYRCRIRPERVIVEDCEVRVIHQSELENWDDATILEHLRRPLETPPG